MWNGKIGHTDFAKWGEKNNKKVGYNLTRTYYYENNNTGYNNTYTQCPGTLRILNRWRRIRSAHLLQRAGLVQELRSNSSQPSLNSIGKTN